MELYDRVARQSARQLTLNYSTSFGLASRLFDTSIRDDIYCMYGLVRIADEIVDTYQPHADPKQALAMLEALEQEVYAALDREYSSNLIVHAFQGTARHYGIDHELIEPFFASMRVDVSGQSVWNRQQYEMYIYGSAEVIGLMCLKVFTGGSDTAYRRLYQGARALGAAYQKVNFLRDYAADREQLGRSYFPEVGAGVLDEAAKAAIIRDIDKDFATAAACIGQLPRSSRAAVLASYRYYHELLQILRATPAAELAQRRVRLPDSRKLLLAAAVYARHRLGTRLGGR